MPTTTRSPGVTGDRDAQRRERLIGLYQAEREGMVRLAHLLTGSVSTAEDLVQEGAAAFLAHVEETAPDALDTLAKELEHGPPTALLCLEADPAGCHRRVLTDSLQARVPDLQVVDL